MPAGLNFGRKFGHVTLRRLRMTSLGARQPMSEVMSEHHAGTLPREQGRGKLGGVSGYAQSCRHPKPGNPMPANTADIRQYLTSAYSDEELTTLCFDYFRDVYDNFATGRTKGQKIQDLIGHCERRDLVSNLLAALEQDRPDQYRKRFGPAVAAPSPAHSGRRHPWLRRRLDNQRPYELCSVP
jgi:Effector-associated domain 7